MISLRTKESVSAMNNKKNYIYMMGGLGNQLFEYAFARNLREIGKEVYLIITSFNRDGLRNFKLNDYNIQIPVAEGAKSYVIDKKIRLGIKGLFSWNIYVAPNTFEYIDMKRIDRYQYFYGYFQNSKYVDPCIDILKRELQYTGSFSNSQKRIIESISVGESVGIHVRRGDYLDNTSCFKIIGVQYYINAMKYMREKLHNPQFYFFSDDISWCKDNFSRLDGTHFIDDKYKNTDVIDFEMLRCCKHFIIGNSTFSWWASRLSEASSKLLIAPREWFTMSELNVKCQKELLNEYILIN